jgi:hypothetical protein
MTTTATNDVEDGPQKLEPIRISINPRFYQLPGAALLVGTTIGLVRGSRRAGLQFQAENAHRAPKTLQGWYFYKKTKNYKMMLGGLQEAGKHASRLGLTALGWVSAEEALRRAGWDDVSELGAGLFTAGTFSTVCKWRGCGVYEYGRLRVRADRLPWKAAGRTIGLGLIVGGTMRGLRWVQAKLRGQQAAEEAIEEVEAA